MARRMSKKIGRGAKGWETRRANMALKAKRRDVIAERFGDTVAEAQLTRLAIGNQVADWESMGAAGLVGHAAHQMGTQEIPAAQSDDDSLGAAIVSAARKHDGAEHVNRLMQIERQKSRVAGIEVERVRQERLREIRDRCVSERIVCGFVAEVKEMERALGGLPYELIWNMNSLTLQKVIEALLSAGYRPEGRNTPHPAE